MRDTRWRVPGTYRALVAASIGALAACASSPSDASGGRGAATDLARSLSDYREMGFLVGDEEFPVVGRVVGLRGPGDSALVGFVASMSPASLSFARDGQLFAASYQVRATIESGGDTLRRVNRREVVRVDDFVETASPDERVFFQRFITLPPGTYSIDVTLRELARRSQGSQRFTLRIPRPAERRVLLSEPLVAFRAAPRLAYDQRPPVIIAPRSTVAGTRPDMYLVVEDYTQTPVDLLVGVTVEGTPVWEDSVALPAAAPSTAIVPIPTRLLPPGRAQVVVQRTADGVARSAPIMVALDDDWAFASYRRALEHLAYALSSDSLQLWEMAGPRERARLWSEFWRATDPDPDTSENEFLREYFERMTSARELYGEPGIPGWRTHRGEVHVKLGRPDRQIARGGPEVGGQAQIEWVYDTSLPFEVRLLFVDEGDFGVFRLDGRSRAILGQALRRLREASGDGAQPNEPAAPERDGTSTAPDAS